MKKYKYLYHQKPLHFHTLRWSLLCLRTYLLQFIRTTSVYKHTLLSENPSLSCFLDLISKKCDIKYIGSVAE